jgi:hypothetical protein
VDDQLPWLIPCVTITRDTEPSLPNSFPYHLRLDFREAGEET